MKTKDFDFHVKAVGEDGVFEGYASTFGNVDSYGEKVMPGAFADSLARHKREGTSPLLLWQHNPDEPLGGWEDMAEDGKGLWGKGRILVDAGDTERRIYKHMKAGNIRGLSIGYREIETQPDGKVLLLKKLDLLEASVVSFPANRRARVELVKSEQFRIMRERLVAGELPSEREFEKGMRDAFGLSNSEAERAVRLFFKQAQGEPEVITAEPSVKRLSAIARAAAAGITIRK